MTHYDYFIILPALKKNTYVVFPPFVSKRVAVSFPGVFCSVNEIHRSGESATLVLVCSARGLVFYLGLLLLF